jgi:pimeloyl-ACP methyl ester carboxylesterase
MDTMTAAANAVSNSRNCCVRPVVWAWRRGDESDLFTPDLAERMCRAIPNARLVDIPGSGHPVPVDQPALFLAAVAPFLFDT